MVYAQLVELIKFIMDINVYVSMDIRKHLIMFVQKTICQYVDYINIGIQDQIVVNVIQDML